MPTIDDLPAAVSVSDGDELVVSQSDIARKATRSQLLAGLQPALAIPSNTLLGRLSAGVGAPETIAIGENLLAANGAISAPAPFVIAQLTTGGAPSATNLVPLAQGGQNAQVSYATFLSGLSSLPGIDGSNLTATASAGGVVRRIADFVSDEVSVESFGAAGDGITDDTAAFIAALASGRPLRLDGRVYIVNGPVDVTSTGAMVGVAGMTIIRRTSLAAGSEWISIASPSFTASGIVFDAGGVAGGDYPAVSVDSSCLVSHFVSCGFENTIGAVSGHGLSVGGVAGSQCQVSSCIFANNDAHGLYGAGAGSLQATCCVATGNAGCGIRVEPGVACSIRDNIASSNGTGISVGAWSSGAAAQQIGPACCIDRNDCTGNATWGIAVAAGQAQIAGNSVQGNGIIMAGGGILARVGASRLSGNVISQGSIGIDARGCWGSVLAENHVSNAGTGIIVGGSQNLMVQGNVLLINSWAMIVSAIEPSLSFLPTGPVTIASNWIGFTTAQGGGVSVLDAAQNIALVNNDINGWGSATINQALWIHTDQAIVKGNRWNNQAIFPVQASVVAGLESLVVPDTADEVLVQSAPLAVASVLTNHQADTLGEIAFIKVTNGGTGYTAATVTISGLGTGAAAKAFVSNGEVIWIIVTNAGSGYGPIGTAATVTIAGNGTGASATAYVGLPVIGSRQLRLSCNCQVQMTLNGSSPAQQSWTEYAATIPAFGAVDLEGVTGGWRAVGFPPVDYLTPTGNGGVILQSVGGANVTLRPASGGALHFASAAEATGCTSSVGRGSPLGTLAAPPGSDFRNLNGGAGNTFWIKQENLDATGWVAIA